jgi:hypothetical protein
MISDPWYRLKSAKSTKTMENACRPLLQLAGGKKVKYRFCW